MNDYISRDAVFDWFCESADIDGCVDLPKNNGSCKKGCRHCIDGKELDEIPTADVVDKERYDRVRENADILSDALSEYQSADMVEVVRCKDCIHYWKNHIETDDDTVAVCLASPKDDAFCSEGERRADDGEIRRH
jgi:hypothetical protein